MAKEPDLPAEEEAQLVEELKRMEYEPMLPVEKKLISYSIVLGIILLILFVWISYTFFPGTH
jgi:type III secretion system FlhB-like substrate exporter